MLEMLERKRVERKRECHITGQISELGERALDRHVFISFVIVSFHKIFYCLLRSHRANCNRTSFLKFFLFKCPAGIIIKSKISFCTYIWRIYVYKLSCNYHDVGKNFLFIILEEIVLGFGAGIKKTNIWVQEGGPKR